VFIQLDDTLAAVVRALAEASEHSQHTFRSRHFKPASRQNSMVTEALMAACQPLRRAAAAPTAAAAPVTELPQPISSTYIMMRVMQLYTTPFKSVGLFLQSGPGRVGRSGAVPHDRSGIQLPPPIQLARHSSQRCQ
jgi:hypothetical protein